MTTTKTVELTYEQTDNIVLLELKRSYESVIEDIARIKEMAQPLSHNLEDLQDNKKIRKALLKVIKYYSIHEEFMAWKKSHK